MTAQTQTAAAPVNPRASPRHTSTATGSRPRVTDPILVEIVQGTLASVEMEVETAIARTSRSPMIRYTRTTSAPASTTGSCAS